MHDQHSRPEGGAIAIATMIAFVAGIAIGINITGGPMAAASDVRAPMAAQARAPALPPEAAAAFAIARRLDAFAADDSRECTARGDGRCFN